MHVWNKKVCVQLFLFLHARQKLDVFRQTCARSKLKLEEVSLVSWSLMRSRFLRLEIVHPFHFSLVFFWTGGARQKFFGACCADQ